MGRNHGFQNIQNSLKQFNKRKATFQTLCGWCHMMSMILWLKTEIGRTRHWPLAGIQMAALWAYGFTNLSKGSEWSDQKLCELHLYCIFFKQALQKLFFWCIVWRRDVLFLLSPGLLISKGSVLNHHGTWWDLWPLGGGGIPPHRRQRRQRRQVVNLTSCGLRLYKMV